MRRWDQVFLAVRDLRFARGRFVLMGAVVALIATLGVLLTGLASGLTDAGVSALRAFFTVWTIQRRPEIALLKAIGGATGYVLRDALAQVLVVLVTATAVGTAVGLGLGSLIGGDVPFALRPTPVLTASLLLVLLGTLGALVAVRRITSVDPLVALGGNR